MTSGAGSTGEDDAGSGVDGQAVVLILDVCVGDGNVGGGSNIEGISVVSEVISVTGRVVNGDAVESETASRVDGEGLDWGIQDVKTRDGGASLQGVSIEELGLGDSAVRALSVPPLGSISIELVSGSSGNSYVLARDGEERTGPLLVFPGSGSLKNDLGILVSSNSKRLA